MMRRTHNIQLEEAGLVLLFLLLPAAAALFP